MERRRPPTPTPKKGGIDQHKVFLRFMMESQQDFIYQNLGVMVP